MREVRAGVPEAVLVTGGLDRVQRLPDGPVAERVEVHLEAERVQLGDVPGQQRRVDEAEPAVRRRTAARVQVGRGHRGGEVLRHAVLHDLHGRAGQPPDRELLAVRDELGDLLRAAVPVPPERAGHRRGQPALGGRGPVRVGRVGISVRATQHRVLPAGDAQRVQQPLGPPQPGHQLGRGGRRNQVVDQGDRALLQRADRVAVRVPVDHAVRRVRRVPGEAGPGHRHRVHPGAVVVAVRQVDRAVRDDPVEQPGGGHATREALHRPAAAGDPLLIGVRGGVRADPGQVLVQVGRPGQVALAHLHPAEDGVDVRVLETGDQQPPGQVDHLGPRAAQVVQVVADREDAPVLDGHRGRPGPGRVGGEHRATGEEQVGGGHTVSSTRFLMKYGDRRRHLARAAVATPMITMSTGAARLNHPLSTLIAKPSLSVA